MIKKQTTPASAIPHPRKKIAAFGGEQPSSYHLYDGNNTSVWIDLNQKTFLIKTSEETNCFGSNVLLVVTIKNSVVYFSRNGLSVKGYREVDRQTEVLDVSSVISLSNQINKQQETLMIPEEVRKVINRMLEDFTYRLKANELWNSRFVTSSDREWKIFNCIGTRLSSNHCAWDRFACQGTESR